MLNFFKKKKAPLTLLDEFILKAYGDPPPTKTADQQMAIQIAHSVLLKQIIGINEISNITGPLYEGKIPYTTNDLALSVALNFFKRTELIPQLKSIQIDARNIVKGWLHQNQVNKVLAESFEYTLNKLYNS